MAIKTTRTQEVAQVQIDYNRCKACGLCAGVCGMTLSPYSDPADPYIAATYAMLAGEALGLGTCMIGAVAPMLKYAAKLKAKYNVRPDMRSGLPVLFGYPAVQHVRGIRRIFANVDYA